MEIRFGGSAADTEKDANTVIITVSVAALRMNHEKNRYKKRFFPKAVLFLFLLRQLIALIKPIGLNLRLYFSDHQQHAVTFHRYGVLLVLIVKLLINSGRISV